MTAMETGTRVRALRCVEVVGGNRRAREMLTLGALDAWVVSDPFEGDARGGDIHYVSLCGAGRIARFAVIDVAGHGVDVGGLATRLRRELRRHVNTLDQTALARVLNEEFARIARAGAFATAVLASYFAPAGTLTVCNAGHPRPLWYRARQGAWCALDAGLPEAANLPLGIDAGADYRQYSVPLEAGDRVLLYTDAFLDGPPQRAQARLLRAAQAASGQTPEGLIAALGRSVSGAHADDRTLLLIEHTGGAPYRPGWRDRARLIGHLLRPVR